MVKFLHVIVSFFLAPKDDTYVLVRIQALVALVTAMFFVMFIVDFYRCRSRSSVLNKVFTTVDSLSDRIVVYLIGSMQAAPFENQMFPVWAVVLVSLRASLGYLSGYGIPDHDRRLSELGNVIKFMGAGVLNGTRALQFTRPLWSLWAVLLAKSLYRFVAHEMASRSLLHGRNSEFLPEYMRNCPLDREQGGGEHVNGQDRQKPEEYLLVCGESSKDIRLKKPSYSLHLDEVGKSSRITLDKILDCKDFETTSSKVTDRYNDISKAFVLSRLLRCRFEDVKLGKTSIDSSRHVINTIINEQPPAAEAAASEQVAAVQTASMAAPAVVGGIEMVGAAAAETATVPEAETVSEAETVAVAAELQGATAPEAETAAVAAESKGAPDPEEEIVVVATEPEVARAPQAVTVAVAAAREGEPAPAAETAAVAEIVSAAQLEGERAFKILELELAFTRDYFHTLYPLVFWWGLGSLIVSLVLSMATFSVALWLACDIRKVYHRVALDKHDNFMLQMHGGNVDVLITWLFMVFMMFKEVWEMVTYLVSNWTRLLLVCKYVQKQPWFIWLSRNGCLIGSFYKSNIADTWHGQMNQYDFLQTCNYRPLFLQVASSISMGKLPAPLDGKKMGKSIKVPNCVKPAILQALRRVTLEENHLPKDIPSLAGTPERFERYSWAYIEPQTCSQVILVWHIATSLCEIELAREYPILLEKAGFLRSAWSRVKKFVSCTSKPPIVNKKMDPGLEMDYQTAISLSRYSAYLHVFLSELLPDNFVVPCLVFEETLKDVREQLKDCNLRNCSYSKLMAMVDETEKVTLDDIKDMNIVQQGATLAKALIHNEPDQKSRWKILAEVWADLLVHMAPSWNAADHMYHLESGGEFITLIWALLSQCGIERSDLWDKDGRHGEARNIRRPVPQVSEPSAKAPQENNAETTNSEPGPVKQVSETSAQVSQESNTETSNRDPGPVQEVSETSDQVPQENNAETGNTQPGQVQQVSQTGDEIEHENNAETSNLEQLDEDEIASDEEPSE